MKAMSTIEELKHHETTLEGGGKIVVLDSGAVLTAEMTAMIQALHSRSTEGIHSHLKVLAERGAEKFMSTYYVQYGHKSIGDCGVGIVFIEGISMLAAKAIQDSKLYNGQEASTRYIDFANQTFLNPLGTAAGTAINEEYRQFYLKAVKEMTKELPNRYPIGVGEKEGFYNKAIAARAFDITRGFLPAGASTNIAWTTTLRQFDDRIMQLSHHPLAEVREIATKLNQAMLTVYPSSFKEDTNERREKYAATHAYTALAAQRYYHHDPQCPELELIRDGVDTDALQAANLKPLFTDRPAQTELPKWLGAYGEAAFAFQLDFGSFRDIQRHRAVTQRMPLLTAGIGFNDWYLNELTPELRAEAESLIEKLTKAATNLTSDVALRQYYLPMGLNISNYLSGDLPALVYLVELRATSLVHPTLAVQAAKMAELLTKKYGESLGLKIHLSSQPGRFDVKRGEADIVRTDQ
jgi:thymidylate synthase ThyX